MSVHRRVRCTDGLLLNHRAEVDILSLQIQLCQCQDDGNLVAATSFVSIGTHVLTCHTGVEVEELVLALVGTESVGSCPAPMAVQGMRAEGQILPRMNANGCDLLPGAAWDGNMWCDTAFL